MSAALTQQLKMYCAVKESNVKILKAQSGRQLTSEAKYTPIYKDKTEIDLS